MSTRPGILVAGSANLDFVVHAHHVPSPGETVLGREFRTFPGGKGANQAVACARAGGAATRMLLALGEDAFAEPIEASLREAGVELHIVRANQPTGTAFICLADDAENAITVAPGANNALRRHHLPSLDDTAYLLLQLETPLDVVTAYARAARASGVRVVLNAAPAQALPASLLADVDVLVVNEGELALLSGVADSVAQGLAQLPQVACIVVTLGARGCVARQHGQFTLQPAFRIEPLDTTAAGDTFCGALAARLAQGDTLADGLRYASAASALACQALGAQSSIPAGQAVHDLLNATPRADDDALQVLARYCGLPSPLTTIPLP
ncbi:ribokinase [Pseudoxanthomonas indica]|uniref:Ribokinase n=1 Tax=Pseudoxanthomonas indica TaxID=428993 RepID=A0A1T5K2N8_9GAMM|nr:ribokinase [Pseudoxanthomonas indica]GGD46120.1 ribokinase [Pseudoxanthomonas indica]SKC57903.1 ribokinase [Pseudoxanthomonas indica]